MAAKTIYQKLPPTDEESASRLLEESSPTNSSPNPFLNTFIPKWKTPQKWETNMTTHPFTTLVTIFLCISVLINISVWHRHSLIETKAAEGMYEEQYGRDIRYMSLSHKYDHLWDRISSDHIGLMKFPDPGSLHPGREAPLGVMSMFHQLHCVSSLRNALQDAYYGNPVAFDQEGNRHWPHCLDYLRKAILCHADDTVEREKIVNGTRTFKIDGLTDVRQCRDNSHIYELLRKHGLPDAKGPLADVDDGRLDWNS